MTTAANISAQLLDDTPVKGRVLTLAEALADLLNRIEANEPTIETIPCGVELIDGTTGGLVRGEYLGITAGPGIGKSTMADSMILGALRRDPGASGLIVALETSVLIRCARLLGSCGVRIGAQNVIAQCLPVAAMLRGKLSDQSKPYARQVAEEMTTEIGTRLAFVDDVRNAADIAAMICERRPDLVLVDHLGLVEAEQYVGSSSVDRFDAALHAIADAIREVNAAGILIAEVSKAGLIAGAADLSAVRGSARLGLPVWPGRCWGSFATPIKSAMIRD
jgi:predicted ATP-dependent serine protease